MSQTLKINMESVPKIRFSTVESSPENKMLANKILHEKLLDNSGSRHVVNFFNAADVWKDIKRTDSVPLEMAIRNNSVDLSTEFENLVTKSITLKDTIPTIYDTSNRKDMMELIRRALIKRFSYETINYSTRYYVRSDFYEQLEVENLSQRIYTSEFLKIKYFIAEVKVSNMLIKKPY